MKSVYAVFARGTSPRSSPCSTDISRQTPATCPGRPVRITARREWGSWTPPPSATLSPRCTPDPAVASATTSASPYALPTASSRSHERTASPASACVAGARKVRTRERGNDTGGCLPTWMAELGVPSTTSTASTAATAARRG
ncbi:hypothetical protein HBB16_15025 [Pseudonocardia sp. MCCB 268]|nr:hypothetical protein [Pseudonocardia cytotoxica]